MEPSAQKQIDKALEDLKKKGKPSLPKLPGASKDSGAKKPALPGLKKLFK